MNLVWVPMLAAIAYAASILIAKIGLTRRRISIRDYIPGIFFFLTFFSIITLPKLGHVNYSTLFVQHNLILVLALIIVATVWNILYYKGLSREKVNTTEGIIILMPLMTIVLSWLFQPEVFNAKIALSATVATVLVGWIYRPHKLIQFDLYTFMLLGAVLLMALENVLAGQILQTKAISPAALYTLRTFLLFVIFYLYYKPSLLRLRLKSTLILALSGLIGTTAMLLRFYGLRDAGITLTAIVLILVPVIVFSAAIIFLHEKMKPARLAAMVFIGVLIIYATFTNYSLLSHK